MQLTKHTDFAFRVLIYLGSQEKGDLSNIQVIAETFDMSRSHVMKIVQKLVAHGVIKSIRGQSGGIQMAKPLADIGLREIVELMEPNLNPVNCDEPACLIRKSCQLKGVLFGAQRAFLEYLDGHTLADIVTPPVRSEVFLGALSRTKELNRIKDSLKSSL